MRAGGMDGKTLPTLHATGTTTRIASQMLHPQVIAAANVKRPVDYNTYSGSRDAKQTKDGRSCKRCSKGKGLTHDYLALTCCNWTNRIRKSSQTEKWFMFFKGCHPLLLLIIKN